MLKNLIEALIFAAAKGVTYQVIKDAFHDEYTEKEIKNAIKEIESEYCGEKGIVLIRYNDTYQFQTNPAYGDLLAEVLKPIKERQLSATVLQTLAIIAYRQPVTRAEIEEVRGGVSSDYAIGVLLRAELIEIVGRKDAVGKPALFATNDNFLKRFQLHSLEELPDYDKLIEYVRHSDKYNKDTENLYRIEEESAAAVENDSEDQDRYFDELSDEKPDFLKDEDVVVIE
ncbi:MAG: SMC-Scp complex subunit ScpB [Christensenellales bacterium]